MIRLRIPRAALAPFLFAVASAAFAAGGAATPKRPNVIVLLTDDLGYGDVGCYGAKPGHVKTPNIDRLAAEGVKFTDGHSASSVCTPSRASLLTGDYAWRHPRGSGILPGDAPLFINPGEWTLPAMFKACGYVTGFVGKWHLGLGEPDKKHPKSGHATSLDWNGEIRPGPLEIGFDTAFFMPATGDRMPTVFIRDRRVENLDPKDPIAVTYANPGIGVTFADNPDAAYVMRANKGCGHIDGVSAGISRIGFMSGGKSAMWKDSDMADTFSREALGFIEKNKDRPFFLYYATHNIHEPRVPNARFVGKSGAGTYGDHILELDDKVGALLDTLKRLGLDENTLVVFSSDNGGTPWLAYDYSPRASLDGHRVNGALRGEKGSVWEGGTRIPFIVRQPGMAHAGKVSPALVSQTDLAASFAGMLGVKLPAGAARDSVDVLPALLGKSDTGRAELMEHRYGPARTCALREGDWKFVEGRLYDLSKDLGEQHDLAKKFSDRAKAMAGRLKVLGQSEKTR